MSDLMVKTVQQWYNSTYVGRAGYLRIDEDGIAGPGTCKALIRALQIELGISGPNGIFGPGTIAAFDAIGINPSTANRNLIRILQGGFYCKGIECGGFDGGYGYKLSQAVIHFRSLTGVGGTGAMDSKHMKALLNTDPFVYDYPGKMYIRAAQQFLNGNYSDYFWKSIGLIPCNGFADRNMSKALTYALQYEEGSRGSALDGIVGTNTLNKAPKLSEGNSGVFVTLLQIGLMCMTGDDVGLDGIFDAGLKSSLTTYQRFMCLHQDSGVTVGEAGRYQQDNIISTAGFRLANGSLFAKVVRYFNDAEQFVLRTKAGNHYKNIDCIDATCKTFINAVMYLDILNNIF